MNEASATEDAEKIREALDRLKNSSMEIGKAMYSNDSGNTEEGNTEQQPEEPKADEKKEGEEEKKDEKKEGDEKKEEKK